MNFIIAEVIRAVPEHWMHLKENSGGKACEEMLSIIFAITLHALKICLMFHVTLNYTLETPKVPFTCIAIDTIGKLPTTSSGNRYALTCIDLLTSYVIALPMPDKTAESVVGAYLLGILSRARASMVCLWDNGSELKNNQMNTVLKQLGIKCIHSNPYRPQGNSWIENFHIS